MKILLNGKTEEIENGSTIRDMIARLGHEQKRVAVAVNSDFVPRSSYAEHKLKENDEVDIVAPMQGG